MEELKKKFAGKINKPENKGKILIPKGKLDRFKKMVAE